MGRSRRSRISPNNRLLRILTSASRRGQGGPPANLYFLDYSLSDNSMYIPFFF
jgi:hypothetical protein